MRRPKHVIFDFDGVLVDSEILASRAEVEVKNELGFPITLEEQIVRFTGCANSHPDIQAELRRLPPEFERLAQERCLKIYAEELRAIDGVTHVLEKLDAPKCIASGSEPDSLETKLQLTGLRKYFPDHVLFHGRTVAVSKPEPDIFLNAMKVLGWRADECLIVEDSEPGVRAGKAAGAIVCAFIGGKHIYPGHAEKLMRAGADYMISDLRNLLRLVE